jgi:peptide/nickel transport system permease protein/oligopeptide transport system permease protein
LAKYLFQRLLQTIFVVLISTVVVFSLLHFAPGDPIMSLHMPGMTQEDVAKLYQKYGLDQPLPVQYIIWLGEVLQGDLGKSILTNKPVNELILRRFTNTLQLTFMSMSIAILLGVFGGVVAATHRGSFVDFSAMIAAVIGFSIPPFWFGLLLILLFSVILKWLPSGGVGTFKHLILPAIALGTASASVIARMTRSAMLEVLSMNYITSARAKGLSERSVIYVHALKNAMIPVVTIIGQMTGLIIAGAVVTETVFSFPGIGFTLVKSLGERDYPVIQAALLLTSVTFIFMNFIIDIIYVLVDPRIRYE